MQQKIAKRLNYGSQSILFELTNFSWKAHKSTCEGIQAKLCIVNIIFKTILIVT